MLSKMSWDSGHKNKPKNKQTKEPPHPPKKKIKTQNQRIQCIVVYLKSVNKTNLNEFRAFGKLK